MDLVQYAVPFFILAMLVEYSYGKWRGRQTYRLNDTVNSLSLGVISRLVDLLRLGFAAYVFAGIAGWLSLPSWSMQNPWQWIVAFVLYDFFYYWKHRFGHEWRIFWASHVAHHQSEYFNLSTALRQTGTDYLGFVFYIPLFVLGLPAEAVITVGSVNLIYQFWVHTEHVPKLGPIEWLFVTPSNHRVHHARNPCYLDKNYGGVFIVWDRLFGSFQSERDDEPCVYGITTGLHSWNPVWANVHVWWETLQIALRTKSWRDKFLVWAKPPGWVPADMQQTSTVNFRAERFDPPVLPWLQFYVFAQFWIVTLLAIWAQQPTVALPRALEQASFAWLVYSLFVFGLLLESRSGAKKFELVRLATQVVMTIWVFGLWQLYWGGIIAGVALAIISGTMVLMPRKASRLETIA